MPEKGDFDAAAATWDEEPRRVQLAREVAQAVLAAVPVTPEMAAMDYGCGTGLVTLFLQPRLGSITGVDTSRGMLEVLERKAREAGLANVRTHLIDPDLREPPAGRFHLIVSSMTLHHVAEPAPLFARFFQLLHPGGYLCLADLDAEDGSFHDDRTGVHHFGFDRGEVKELLARAGFTAPTDATAGVIHKGTPQQPRDYPVFLVSARRPA